MWRINGWEKKKSRPIQVVPDHFFKHEYRLLVVHESQIAIYDPTELECHRIRYPRDSLSSLISCVTSSCDGQIIYAGFYDGAVGIFGYEDLELLCWIASSTYISSLIPSDGNAFFKVVDIAAHPKNPKEFAIGLSNGAVYVIQPLDAETKSEGLSCHEDTMLPSMPSTSSMKEEPLETPSSSSGNLHSQ